MFKQNYLKEKSKYFSVFSNHVDLPELGTFVLWISRSILSRRFKKIGQIRQSWVKDLLAKNRREPMVMYKLFK